VKYLNMLSYSGLGGKAYRLSFTNCMFSVNDVTQTQDAVNVSGGSGNDDFSFINCTILMAGRHGMNCADVSNLTLIGNSFIANGLTTPNSYAHLAINNCNLLNITGNRFLHNTLYTLPGGSMEGEDILFYTAMPTQMIVQGNVFTNAVAINFAGLTPNAGTRFFDNIGYNPQALSAPAVGASPWTYTNNSGYIENLYFHGGTITNTLLNRTGSTSYNILAGTSRTIQLYPGDSVTVTHAGTPTLIIQPM